MMKCLCLLVVSLISSIVQGQDSAPHSPRSSACWMEAFNRRFRNSRPVWLPSCMRMYMWNPQQCDAIGDCWCVNQITGQPLNNRVHRNGEVDCVQTQKKCLVSMNEEYRNCVTCTPTCDNPSKPCSPFCLTGCACPPGFYRNQFGSCVQLNECRTPNCPPTMVYRSCAGCAIPCNQRHQRFSCASECLQGCTCPPNTYLLGNICVTEKQCLEATSSPKVTVASSTVTSERATSFLVCNLDLNESFETCASQCDPTCGEPKLFCSVQSACHQRCACRTGNVRNEVGVCVSLSQCTVRDNMFMTTCQVQRLINQPRYATECDTSGHFNTTQCIGDKCFCVDKKTGEVLEGTHHEREGYNVHCSYFGNCPPNMSFSFCSTNCPPTCDDPNPRCNKGCAMDCSCKKGMVRASSTNITCIPVQECPAPRSCAYRRYVESRKRNIVCDPDGSFAMKQCDQLGWCWCVDKEGIELANTRVETKYFDVNVDCSIARSCEKRLDEMYLSCAPSCDATCAAPRAHCSRSKSCQKRCGCLKGWLRNNQNICVLRNQCLPPSLRSLLPAATKIEAGISSCFEKLIEVIAKLNVSTSSNESISQLQDAHIPSCDALGRFNSTQCYGFLQECWCVDVFTGVEKSGSRRPQFNPKFSIDCNNYVAPPAPSTRNIKVLNPPPPSIQVNKGISNCIEKRDQVIAKLNVLTSSNESISQLQDAHIPSCDKLGRFNSTQCYGFLQECWCVDVFTGEEKIGSRGSQFNPKFNIDCNNYVVPPAPSTRNIKVVNPPPPPPPIQVNKGISNCFEKRNQVIAKLNVSTSSNESTSQLQDAHIPSCDKLGRFNSTQCYGFIQECWCVDVFTGEEKIGSRGSQFNPKFNIDCNNYVVPPAPSTRNIKVVNTPPPPPPPIQINKGISNCFEKRDQVIAKLNILTSSNESTSQLQDAHIPSCDKLGRFNSTQCYGFLQECWCVDVFTGEEKIGSRGSQFNPKFSIDCNNYVVPPAPSAVTPESSHISPPSPDKVPLPNPGNVVGNPSTLPRQ